MFVHLFPCVIVCLSVFMHNSKSNKQIFLAYFLWVGPDQMGGVIEFCEIYGSYSEYKKFLIFKGPIANVLSMAVAFWLTLLQK